MLINILLNTTEYFFATLHALHQNQVWRPSIYFGTTEVDRRVKSRQLKVVISHSVLTFLTVTLLNSYNTRYVNMKAEFLYRKYTFIVWKLLKIFYSKYCPSLAVYFSHLSGNWWMPRQKNCRSFEANQSSSHFRTFS